MESIIVSHISKNSKALWKTPSNIGKELPLNVLAAGHFCAYSKYYVERDSLEGYLLIYTMSGSGALNYHGKDYQLKPGHVFLINGNEYHKYLTTPNYDQWEFKWLRFGGNACKNYYELLNDGRFNVLAPNNMSKIEFHFNQILEKFQKSSQLDEVMQSMVITNLLTELVWQSKEQEREQYSLLCSNVIEEMIRYFEENYQEKIRIKNVCKNYGISEFYFNKMFKKLVGIPPYAYVTQYRINRSKHLLLETDEPISEIAVKVGFENQNNYIRNFKLLVGTTPLRFRNTDL